MKDTLDALITLSDEYFEIQSEFVKGMRSKECDHFERYKEICKKMLVIDFKDKFSNVYKLSKGNDDNFLLLLRKVLILAILWIAGKDLMKQNIYKKRLLQQNNSTRYIRGRL